jgi:hypothetical protein
MDIGVEVLRRADDAVAAAERLAQVVRGHAGRFVALEQMNGVAEGQPLAVGAGLGAKFRMFQFLLRLSLRMQGADRRERKRRGA